MPAAKVLYSCDVCGLHYTDKYMADRCNDYCKKHNACSLEIARHSIEFKPKK